MKTRTSFPDIAALENELAEIAPLVREGFRQAGGPSLRVETAIRQQARTCAGKKSRRLSWPLYRILAAAASLALLMGGALQLHLVRQADLNAQAVHHILNIGTAQASAEHEHPAEGTTGLANRLLDIQGLDEEGFFKAEEAEPLWL